MEVEVRPTPFPMAVIPQREIPEIVDDMNLEFVELAGRRSLEYLERLDPSTVLSYGPIKVRVRDSVETIGRILELVSECRDARCVGKRLREEFVWLRVAGKDETPGKVLLTGYYLPRLPGSLDGKGDYRFPIYGLPEDLVEVDLGLFAKDLEGRRIVGRFEGRRLVPYYTRCEIDRDMKLHGRGLEIAWVKDPIERFFLHIQGSGEVVMEDGSSFMLGYHGSNGHPYRSLGRVLVEMGALSEEEVSMQTIRAYLADHREEMDSLFCQNPSYVFFKRTDGGPLGHLNVPLTEGRSIATDRRIFPPAAVAVLCSTLPEEGARGKRGPRRPFCRIVFNQDTGGAIKGKGRVDLYCGSGPHAELVAGNLQEEGSLYFLLKKDLLPVDP